MILPKNTNPTFVAWYNAQSADVKEAIDAAWASTTNISGLVPGHRSEEYARLTFLIAHCQDAYGYNG